MITKPPSLWRWSLGASLGAAIAGTLCCVVPAVLFLVGVMGGISAISFANAFYRPDGSTGAGAWLLRCLAAGVGIAAIVVYRRRAAACTTDPRALRRNVALVAFMVAGLGTAGFAGLYRLSGWYFDRYVVPAQQAEYRQRAGGH